VEVVVHRAAELRAVLGQREARAILALGAVRYHAPRILAAQSGAPQLGLLVHEVSEKVDEV
jgi:hypothetical protein